MTIKKAKKMGFFSALTICVGSVVGIGIFFKNASIQGANQGIGISWFLSWLFGGIIALMVAIHFAKIASTKTEGKETGLSAWANIHTKKNEKWFYKLVSINYSFFYYSILYIVLLFFSGETIIKFIYDSMGISDVSSFPVWAIAIISIILGIIITLSNYFSKHFVGIVSSISTVIKFIPLIVVIFSGMILFDSNNLPNENGIENGFDNTGTFVDSFKGIMISLPAVLFAFDSFLGVAVLENRVKGGEKTIAKVFVYGMSAVTIIYVLVAVVSIIHITNPSFIQEVIKDIFPQHISSILNIFLSLIIFISVFGTTTAVGAVTFREFENLIYKKIIWNNNSINNSKSIRNFSTKIAIIFLLFWASVIYIPASIMNNDQIVDGFSNFPVIMFFVVYLIMIFFWWKNYYIKQEGTKWKKNIYSFVIWTTIILVAVSVITNLVIIISKGFLDPNSKNSWGLFWSNSNSIINNQTEMIIYGVFIFVFFLTPFLAPKINTFLNNLNLKKHNK